MPEYECEVKFEATRYDETHAMSHREAEEQIHRRKTAGGPPTVTLHAPADELNIHCYEKH